MRSNRRTNTYRRKRGGPPCASHADVNLPVAEQTPSVQALEVLVPHEGLVLQGQNTFENYRNLCRWVKMANRTQGEHVPLHGATEADDAACTEQQSANRAGHGSNRWHTHHEKRRVEPRTGGDSCRRLGEAPQRTGKSRRLLCARTPPVLLEAEADVVFVASALVHPPPMIGPSSRRVSTDEGRALGAEEKLHTRGG